MKKLFLIVCGCALFASFSSAQQDSAGLDKRHKSADKHNSRATPKKNAAKTDTTDKKRTNKKGGVRNNMDSTATMDR